MNCGPSQQTLEDPRPVLRDRSEFGENRSLAESASNLSGNGNTRRHSISGHYHDEPEADYDNGATVLYRCIEGKDWDGALSRLELAPIEAKTWVSRRDQGSDQIRWRLLPLHAVCIFRAPLALIEALLEVYADGPKMKDDQGMLPVHLACRNGASKGVVLTLLAAFPESINIRDRKNRLPVDLVEASNSQNKENVLSALKKFQRDMIKMNYMADYQATQTQGSSQNSQKQQEQQIRELQTNPTGIDSGIPTAISAVPPEQVNVVVQGNTVKEVDYENRTVLFRMILKKDWEQASARARTFPAEAATWIVTKGFNGSLRFLPLHKACVLQPPSNVIESLLEAYPEGAEAKDQDGWLPIHCACFYGADADVINNLLNAYSRGATQKDEEGRLPLHYACLKGASQEVVDVLLATSSKSAMAKDDEGRLPIHHACGKGAPEGVIDALLKASPKGAQSKDDQGRLPLHHACRKSTSERVIRTLLRVYPRAAQIKDDQDKLAVHYACQHGASATIINLLLSTFPESINAKNGFGSTPIAEVKAANNSNKEQVLKLLEKFKKEHDLSSKSEEMTEADIKIKALQEKVSGLEKTLGKISSVGLEIKNDLRRGRDPEEVLEDLADRLLLFGKDTSSNNNEDQSATTPLRAKQSVSVSTTASSFRAAAVVVNSSPVNSSSKSPAKSSSASRSTSAGRTSTSKNRRSTTPSKGLFGRKKSVTNQ